MKTKVLFVFAAALFFSLLTGAVVSASGVLKPVSAVAGAKASGPVGGIQVIIQQDPEGYRGARPTDDAGGAAFANIEAGKYTISLKRFTKATGSYNVSITSTNGVKMSEVWQAENKDTFKTKMEITGRDMYMVDVKVTSVEAPAGTAPKTEE
jgi:hypothetical protein